MPLRPIPEKNDGRYDDGFIRSGRRTGERSMPDMTERGAALLRPDDCCLAFVDFVGLPDLSSQVSESYHGILQLTRELSVPVLSTSRAGEGGAALDPALEAALVADGAYERSVLNPWMDRDFRQRLFEYDRPRLVMAGGCSEGSLTQAALSALEDMYDVFIIFDLSDEKLNREASPMAYRLIQSGVVPVTARQLLLEWSEAEPKS